MPTELPNGLKIVNVTPHSLVFYCGYKEGEVTVPSDGVVNARPLTSVWSEEDVRYKLTTTTYVLTLEGEIFLNQIEKQYPGALIVGSIIAAEGYPGRIVAPAPLKHERGSRSPFRLSRSDRFRIFPQENKHE